MAKNLDAFCGTLRYIDFSGMTGLVLVLRDFDRFFEADARWAAGAIDVIAQVSREHLMRGYRLLTLLHAEGRAVDLGKIGGFKGGSSSGLPCKGVRLGHRHIGELCASIDRDQRMSQ